jgi:CheY-like chemotaxis protein
MKEMAVQSTARVLVIDNDPRVGEDLQAMLEPPEYRVKVVQGCGERLLDDARIVASRFRPHVAVVDLRLLDEYSDERSGLALLRHLRPARCILYSAYLKPEVTSQASKRHGASDWVGKDEAPQRLLSAIAEAAQESCAGHRRLAIHRPFAWTPRQVVSTLFRKDTDIPPETVEDVLAQLFPGSTELTLGTVGGEVATPLPVSRGRSVVLKVLPGDLEPVVVKLAPADKTKVEAENYRKYVKGRLVGRFHARLERTVEFWDLGGAVYTFLSSSLRAMPSFTTFYRKETDHQVILRPLHHFFREVWSKHYGEPLPYRHIPLFQIYDRTLDLKQRLTEFSNHEDSSAFHGLADSLRDPVPWVLRHADDSLIPGARQVVTHGDLHGDNLFVSGEYAWAIDFERTGPGHILQDFVELEVDIATRLIPFPKGDLSRFYELALVLAESPEPIAPLRPVAQLLADPETHKALSVITQLRSLAHEVTHFSDSREYIWGLLLDALFVSTLVLEDSPQRERALLLAAVLVGRLRHWGREWPPRDWPRFPQDRESPQVLDVKATEDKGARNMLQPEQQAALTLLTEATKFLFSELGKRLDFWRQKKGETAPQTIEPEPHAGTPTMRLDDLERAVNLEALFQARDSIVTSLDTLRRLARELDGHRRQLLTDTLVDPKTRAWLENRIPEVESLIAEEGERLQGLLGRVYGRR